MTTSLSQYRKLAVKAVDQLFAQLEQARGEVTGPISIRQSVDSKSNEVLVYAHARVTTHVVSNVSAPMTFGNDE